MPELIAKQNMRYGTRALKAGDVFTANDRDSMLLTRLGRATRAAEREAMPVLPITPEAVKVAHQVTSPPQSPPEKLSDDAGPPIDTPPEVDTGEGENAVSRLRREFLDLTGVEADQRWSARTLRRKIERARTGHSG